MREAVIVSVARTPIGRAFRGAFNQTPGATMAGYVVKHAIERASVKPEEVEDVIIGCGLPEGASGNNIGRTSALRAGCPVSVSGQTVSRYCASGLDAIATAAKRVIVDNAAVVVAGGVESISMVQNSLNLHFFAEEWLLRHEPDLYTPMLYTADFVARKYAVSRQRQDEYALQSQQRTAAAQAAGRFDAEIVPMPSWKYAQERETGAVHEERVELAKDEGNRPTRRLKVWRRSRAPFRALPIRRSRPATRRSFPMARRPSWSCLRRLRRRADFNRSGFIVATWSRGAIPARWESGRCTRFPSCSIAKGSRSATSVCGSSTKRSPCKPSIAATRSAFPTIASTSTAARSRSVTRTA